VDSKGDASLISSGKYKLAVHLLSVQPRVSAQALCTHARVCVRVYVYACER